MEVQIKEMIDNYCRTNHLDTPVSREEYIRYAKRFVDVAIISKSEYDEFVMSTTEDEDITDAWFSRIS